MLQLVRFRLPPTMYGQAPGTVLVNPTYVTHLVASEFADQYADTPISTTDVWTIGGQSIQVLGEIDTVAAHLGFVLPEPG